MKKIFKSMELTKNQKNGSIELFGRGRWENRFPLWGQLNFIEKDEKSTTSTFTSIVWRDGLRAYVASPYLCAPTLIFTRLSYMATITIIFIAAKTKIRKIKWNIKKFFNK